MDKSDPPTVSSFPMPHFFGGFLSTTYKLDVNLICVETSRYQIPYILGP